MRNILLFGALVLSMGSSADASILGYALDYDGVADTLRDASAGNIIDRNSNQVVDADDIIQGIVHFNQVDGKSGSNLGGSVFAAYSFKVVSSSATTITVTAATGADNIETILSNGGVNMTGLSQYKGRTGAAGLIVIENSQTNISLMDKDGSGGGGDTFDGGDLAGNFGSSWTAVLTGGFLTADDQHVISAANGFTINSLTGSGTSIDQAGAGARFGTFAGNYSVLKAGGPMAGSTVYKTIENVGLGSPGDRPSGEIVIANGSLEGFDSTVSGSNWLFQDDGDYKINPIPEPSTIAIWAALGLGGCGLVARRRMKAKKA